MNRLTKIVCTLGPSTDDMKSIRNVVDAGMDFARLNFSHGSYEEHKKRIDIVKSISASVRRIMIIQDLPGPKLRVGTIKGRILLKEGAKVRLINHETEEKGVIPLLYDELYNSVSAGSTILLCDGTIKLKVIDVYPDGVYCIVENGGSVISRKGANITGISPKVSAVTKEDIEHIKFGIASSVDYIALSFVTKADDIRFAKSIISKEGSHIPIISKIEKSEALDNLDEIIKVSDAIMVARGDLAMEIGIENLPLAQKRIIKRSNEMGKPVITATQMLYSMVKSKVPTRAEVSDIANAVIDGTDALMLSEETTVGKYPARAVSVLDKMASRMEKEPEIMARLGKRNNEFYDMFLGLNRAHTSDMLNITKRKPALNPQI